MLGYFKVTAKGQDGEKLSINVDCGSLVLVTEHEMKKLGYTDIETQHCPRVSIFSDMEEIKRTLEVFAGR